MSLISEFIWKWVPGSRSSDTNAWWSTGLWWYRGTFNCVECSRWRSCVYVCIDSSPQSSVEYLLDPITGLRVSIALWLPVSACLSVCVFDSLSVCVPLFRSVFRHLRWQLRSHCDLWLAVNVIHGVQKRRTCYYYPHMWLIMRLVTFVCVCLSVPLCSSLSKLWPRYNFCAGTF